ncbi:trehalose operon repressor TreR [Spirabiliibacterium falconis]|uniref:trehalose operon repressor TreR n=1 Tax=Spirabiliibacterium falconis TaxID=572023 RepID=UPI001AADFCB5|nr:trehalose operon repressor TreR [Spirabiliibacterium falconis]MBE2894799.1 HTH-type transcriptional regulator TreR [Spirabiliibacterium falconis]
MKLTIKDIAKLTGVGKSTVSRVLNNAPNVSEKTKAKVMAVVNEHHFTPSRSARAMRGVEPRAVGIIVTRLDSPSENRALRGMLSALQCHDCEHFIVESRFEPHLVQEHLRFFAQRQVDGIIVFAFSGLDEAILLPFKHKLVAMAQSYPALSHVVYDDYAAVTQLLAYLYRQQHRHIAYIGVDLTDNTTGRLRFQAYQDFCQQHQLIPHFALGKLDYYSGYKNIQTVLSDKTSAIVCASDTLALGVNKYLAEQGKSAVVVCGIGNNPLLKFLFPNTLSVEFGFYRAGQQAVTQLFALLDGKNACIQHCISPEFHQQ